MTASNNLQLPCGCPDSRDHQCAADQPQPGWLHSRCRVKATRPIDVDNLLAALVGRLGGRIDARHRDSAQLKVTGFAEGRISVANLGANTAARRRPAQPGRQSQATATDIELIVNAHIAMAPELLQQEVHTAVAAVAEEFGGRAAFGESSSFHPDGPGATPRLVEVS